MSDATSVPGPATGGKERLAPGLALTLAVLAVGSAAVLVESARASPLAIAFWRLCLAVVVLLPWALRERVAWGELLARRGALLVGAGGLLALHFVSWFASLRFASVLVSTVLVSSYPLLLYGWERWQGEPDLAPGKLVAIVGALMGVGLLTVGQGGGHAALLGAGLALLGALAMAVYLWLGRKLRGELGVFSYAVAVYGAGALLLLAGSLAGGVRLAGFSAGTDAALLALALGPTVVGHTGFNYALRYLPATTVGMAQLGEPVVAALLAYVFFHQRPTPLALLGALFVLAGIFAFTRKAAPSP